MSRRYWTDAERAEVARLYPTATAAAIGRTLGRSARAVYLQAEGMGLSKVHRATVDAAFLASIRSMHAEGLTDPEIADRLRCERHTLSKHRRALGLPSNRLAAPYRRRVAEKTADQCREMGCRNLAEVRVLAHAARSYGRGWPADLRPREVDILAALEAKGPMTRPEIAEAIGANWRGSRLSLKCKGGRGSYLANLLARNLVVSLGRLARVVGKGKGRSMQVYSLAITTQREERFG